MTSSRDAHELEVLASLVSQDQVEAILTAVEMAVSQHETAAGLRRLPDGGARRRRLKRKSHAFLAEVAKAATLLDVESTGARVIDFRALADTLETLLRDFELDLERDPRLTLRAQGRKSDGPPADGARAWLETRVAEVVAGWRPTLKDTRSLTAPDAPFRARLRDVLHAVLPTYLRRVGARHCHIEAPDLDRRVLPRLVRHIGDVREGKAPLSANGWSWRPRARRPTPSEAARRKRQSD